MRHDPQRFTTFVLGTFVLVYYGGIGLQSFLVRRKIGRSPILWRGDLRQKLQILLGAFWPLPVIAWAYDPGWFSWVPKAAGLECWPARLAGVLLLCLSTAVAATAYAELGKNWRVGIESSAAPELVSSGIYGSVRHPVYGAFWLALLGVFLMAPNLVFGLLWAAGGSAVGAQADREERALESALGEPYRRYVRTTGKFFPLWY